VAKSLNKYRENAIKSVDQKSEFKSMQQENKEVLAETKSVQAERENVLVLDEKNYLKD
jgi:hypothetical protein